jgi:hypothetical protein
VSKPFFGSLALAVCLALSLASPAQAASVSVREGTEVRLQMAEKLSSANAVVGQRFNLRLEDDIRVNGQVVVPRGAMAVGSVINTRKKGFMGKAGELDVKLDYLLVGDQHLQLRATSSQTGSSKVGATVALTVLFGPIGLLKRGKDVVMAEGMSIAAFVDQTTDVAVADAPTDAPAAAEAAPAADATDAVAPAATAPSAQ